MTTYADGCVIVAINGEIDDVLAPMLLDLSDYCYLVFVSDWFDSSYGEVRDELINRGFNNPLLVMRRDGDYRDDAVFKEEIYEKCIKRNWPVHLVFDDQDGAVKMWRDKGLTCYQVADGGS